MNRKLGVIAGLVLVLVVGHTANAAPKATGTVAEVLVTDVDGDGLISYGDRVSADVTTTADASYVRLACEQDGAVVAVSDWHYFDESAYTFGPRGLYSPIWTGGAATCRWDLFQYRNGKDPLIASDSFEVAG